MQNVMKGHNLILAVELAENHLVHRTLLKMFCLGFLFLAKFAHFL